MVQQDAEPGDGGNEPGRVEGDGPVSLPPIPMSSLAAPDLGEGGDGGLASLTAAWEGSGSAPLGGYSEDDEEGRMVAAKLRRMLERKIDLWDPEEVFELMPTLMKVGKRGTATLMAAHACMCVVRLIVTYPLTEPKPQGDRFEWALEQRLADPATTPKEKKRLEHSRGFLASLKYAVRSSHIMMVALGCACAPLPKPKRTDRPPFLINTNPQNPTPKKQEQQRLAREWIEGVLEAATESAEAMDEQIYELAEYESGVLVQPVLEALDQMLRRLKEMSPDEKTLTQVVMETLRKRVEAEVKTREQPFVRLLAVLLRLETAADRERVLRTELRNSRLVAEFAAWLEEGIDYVARLQLGPQRLPDNTAEEMAKVLALLRGFMGDDPAAGDARPPAGEGAGGGVIDVGEGGPPSQG